ncbi:MAG: universal stress protein [bacterium]
MEIGVAVTIIPSDPQGETMNRIDINAILLATDFSDRSEAAEKYAVTLASQANAALHVVTAIEPIMGIEDGDEDAAEFEEFYAKLIRRAERELEKRLHLWTEMQMIVKHHIQLGHRWRVIVETAEAENVDLLVLGRRHTSSPTVLGTTSQKVFLGSQRPVLFVPEAT